jgi:protein ImuB
MLLCIEIEAPGPGNVILSSSTALRTGSVEGWEEMLDVLDAVSPLIDDVRPGLAFLEMHGIPGDARAWMAQTRTVLAPFEQTLRLGAGSNKIVARAAAYVADGSICEPGAECEMLALLPLTLLDIEAEVVERLALLGIERLGDLAALPHGPFVRRFGAAATDWHELARGIDRRPFVPRSRAVAIEASIFGEGRAVDEAQVFFALRMLLTRVCADLARCGRRAGALHLALELEDAQTCTFDVPLAMPTAHERTMFDMMRAKLEGATFESAIVGLRVQARQLEEGGEAQALFGADDFDPQRVAVTIARLEAMLGERISRATTREAHLLEERFAYEQFELPRKAMLDRPEAPHELVPQLRLLEAREIAVELRAREPAMVDGQAVMQCVGPWRIAERAHAPSPVARDEYDVVLEDGTFARIYRQNTHWYLRGIYE